MITNFYTLQALVEAWRADGIGCIVGDSFSQERDAWTLALASPQAEWMLHLCVRHPFPYLYRSAGYNRARRNVATLFADAFDRTLENVRIAERDRVLYLDLSGGWAFQIMLFGPHANVLLVNDAGRMVEAFQRDAVLAGQAAPKPRPAPVVASFADFEARWSAERKTVAQAVARAFPLMDRQLAEEVVFQAGVVATHPTTCGEAERRALFEAGQTVIRSLAKPTPCLYWRENVPEAFSLVPLQHLHAWREERLETLDEALSLFIRRRLGMDRFLSAYQPLLRTLQQRHGEAVKRAEHMLEDLAQASRADRYEQWGHLLMAGAAHVPQRATEVMLPNLFDTDSAPVTIPLDPQQTAIENAQRYYAKARQTRQARSYAETRLLATEAQATTLDGLLTELEGLQNYRDVEAFRKRHAEALRVFLGQQADDSERLPFRRFALAGGYEVWVGKNAKQNDALTFRQAQKYDLWLHARGVAGSHTLLRLPNRHAQPDPAILDQAAAIAAYYSKAKGSHLVPVIVVPRKYVRKAKGGPPGAVLVERETVRLVEPGLP